MATLSEILQEGLPHGVGTNPSAGADDLRTGAWPYPPTEFSTSLRRRADRLPQIPARLSMTNMIKSLFNNAADVTDYINGSIPGQPGPARPLGRSDLVHSPGQEDYRAAPFSAPNIVGMGLGVVPPRGVPTEDRKNLRENYLAWEAEQRRRAGAGDLSPRRDGEEQWP